MNGVTKEPLRVVTAADRKAQQEHSEHEYWAALESFIEGDSDYLPPLHQLKDVKGTWLEHLTWKKDKKEETFRPANNLATVIVIFAHDPRWSGVLKFDEFAQRIHVTRRPPWSELERVGPLENDDWDPAGDTIRAASWLIRNYNMPLGQEGIMSAVLVAAKLRSHHPVRDYLHKCLAERDDLPYMDTWLGWFGVELTPYAIAVGRAFLIGAVARVMQPGCKLDTMVIFEGEQGAKKSSGLRALAGAAWYVELGAAIDPEKTPLSLVGKWIVEFGELSAFKRARDNETIKGFLTKQDDHYRVPYGRSYQTVKRQCAFTGTTNAKRYLSDETGDRRYLPLRCGIVRRDIIEKMRDQLWGEAMQAYQAGENWWLDGDVLEHAKSEQEERFDEDGRTGDVMTFCDKFVPTLENPPPSGHEGGFTIAHVMAALQIDASRQDRSTQTSIGMILSKLGYAPYRRKPTRYSRPRQVGNTVG